MNDAPPRATGSRGAGRRAERGSVLLVVVILATAAAAMSASLLHRAGSLATELGARRRVLCARYGAISGLALGAVTADPAAAAALVGPDLTSLAITKVRLSATWCVLRATATCAGASRSADRTLAATDCGT
ncbi:MAG TPA: hypothetical protein VGK20_18525 [Candidatus Binatia bacterium]|jgi:hypothetical protein